MRAQGSGRGSGDWNQEDDQKDLLSIYIGHLFLCFCGEEYIYRNRDKLMRKEYLEEKIYATQSYSSKKQEGEGMGGEGAVEVCEARDIQVDPLGYAININRSMKRSWCSTETHLQSHDQVWTVYWFSQESV